MLPSATKDSKILYFTALFLKNGAQLCLISNAPIKTPATPSTKPSTTAMLSFTTVSNLSLSKRDSTSTTLFSIPPTTKSPPSSSTS